MEQRRCLSKFLAAGELELSEFGVTLAKGCQPQKVLGAIPHSQISGIVKNGRYHNFAISTHLLGARVGLRPFFEANMLRWISLTVILGPQDVWPETRQELKEEAAVCEKWVLEKVGIALPAKFSWGELNLVVDTISWDIPIVIKYY